MDYTARASLIRDCSGRRHVAEDAVRPGHLLQLLKLSSGSIDYQVDIYSSGMSVAQTINNA